ncbi:MAG: ComEC/Rec2 family competence protein [Anaerolineales bacterium]|nr:ComEC/Rec2 family competence protein [Anaerolineales bacterium]
MTLFYVCIAWLAGIALASPLGLPFFASLISGILIFLFAFTIKKFRIPFLCLAFFLFGGARLAAAQPKPGPQFTGSYIGIPAEFEAVLEEEPRPGGRGFRVRARVARVIPESGMEFVNLDGAILLEFRSQPEDTELRYGDRLRLSGVLGPPPVIQGFDYADYLARQGIYGILSEPTIRSVTHGEGSPIFSALFAYRRRALETLKKLFPEPECALLSGILLGEESTIPVTLQESFSRTGTSHIVAISGFNISIIAGIFLSLAKRLPRRIPGWLAAILGIALYTVLVGAAASVVRAAIMGAMAIFARQSGRRSHGLTSLAFTGAVMTVFSPWILWDIGFQLSFAATLGLILYADPLQNGVERLLLRRMPKEKARAAASTAGEIILMTLAAQITTLPVLLLYFNNLSLSAFLINPLVLSVQPLVMIAGGLGLLLGMLYLPAGQLVAWMGWAPTAYTIRMVEWGAAFPSLSLPTGPISPIWIGVYYAILFGLTVDSIRKRIPHWEWGKDALARILAVAPPVLAVAAFIAWGAYFHRPDGRLHLTMLATGGGEAFLIRGPAGGTVLVNAGGDPNLVVSGLGRILGYGPQRLDWVVAGSTAWENTTALAEVAARFQIGSVLLPAGTDRHGKALSAFVSQCGDHDVPIYEATAGSRLDLGGGSSLSVLTVGGDGMVLLVERGRSRWLILDGLDETVGRRLLSQGRVPSAQIILFPLSIKETGSPADWLRAARPLAGLWPFAEDLAWPDGAALLRTDAYGWVDLSTDGMGLWVRSEK